MTVGGAEQAQSLWAVRVHRDKTQSMHPSLRVVEAALNRQRWREANERTRELIENAGLASAPLHRLDRLWVEATAGRHGFSVQAYIWRSMAGPPFERGPEIWEFVTAFGDRVGWRRQNAWRYWSEPTAYDDAPWSLPSTIDLPVVPRGFFPLHDVLSSGLAHEFSPRDAWGEQVWDRWAVVLRTLADSPAERVWDCDPGPDDLQHLRPSDGSDVLLFNLRKSGLPARLAWYSASDPPELKIGANEWEPFYVVSMRGDTPEAIRELADLRSGPEASSESFGDQCAFGFVVALTSVEHLKRICAVLDRLPRATPFNLEDQWSVTSPESDRNVWTGELDENGAPTPRFPGSYGRDSS